MAEDISSAVSPTTLDILYDSASSMFKEKYDPIRLTAQTCLSLFQLPIARKIFGHDNQSDKDFCHLTSGDVSYLRFLSENVQRLFQDENGDSTSSRQRSQILHIGLAALFGFLQSNVTGPPLAYDPAKIIIPTTLRKDVSALTTLRQKMIHSISIDGETAYELTPNVELFCVAKALLVDADVLLPDGPLVARTARLRVNFLHQKLLSEVTGTLQRLIYDDLKDLERFVLGYQEVSPSTPDDRARFLLERAIIHTHHGFDAKARADLEQAAVETGFEFALTGKLGKRTKFQDHAISQLVVLAKSANWDSSKSNRSSSTLRHDIKASKPKTLDLNDDTLFEAISFSKEDKKQTEEKALIAQDESSLSPVLSSIDPSDQPELNPLDSANLLAIASAITKTSPDHGLTREETLPYAIRVLESGSSNWQIYTQALLIRSRIEGHMSRALERSVLQMQSLVDQVIADTGSTDTGITNDTTSFLPKTENSASAEERLEYIWALNFSTRWSLEAELASRWASVGGLRTALEIYERLQMWAEVALCYMGTAQEEKARSVLRKQLYEPSDNGVEDDNDKFEGPELSPLPDNAPRLFCILGDIDGNPSMYDRAWEVSNYRFARAQRSVARHYLTTKPRSLEKAEEAYRKSLQINPLNHGAWFAIGCVQLEQEKWIDAVESFTRTVQLEDSDAEAWSNLAAALLRVSSSESSHVTLPDSIHSASDDLELEEGTPSPVDNPHKSKREALTALHHAARLKHSDYRIWDNVLTVAASIPPPGTPLRDVILAQRRVIEIIGPKNGESCIDLPILTMLVDHMIANFEYEELLIDTEHESSQERVLRSGTIPGQIISLIDERIVPLITHSGPLWLVLARVEQFRHQPSKALEAHEKAWRAVVASSTHGAFQMGDAKKWMDIVRATERLVRDGYATLGGMERGGQSGYAEREGGLVAKDWRFKARSAVRGIMGKGKEFWEDTEGWNKLKELASDVSGNS
ncbi:hypothetical protein Egran_04561 [Elaphomyces granulatus]|uniref:Uncharacterized protein n=1 Tax=Elaphomyces granulatus TaxID=519963 RepID=A0A232LU66_9EURO|nr:hypothetical protein Egran_04561 [Elaphomyces granulatus]